MTEEELLQLKKDIEKAKTNIAELKGERQAVIRQLKATWNCSTIEEAQLKIAEKQKELKIISKKIEDNTQQLEEKYFKNET